MRFSLRTWMSVATLVLILLILFFSRHELFKAWELLGKMNIGILVLLIPLIMASYLVSGEMLFSFLRQKGLTRDISLLQQMRMSLEMNFVNHALPSGGVSGVSYMTWRMKQLGISASKATTAQLVRFVAGLASFLVLVVVAVIAITVDGDINRWIILVSSTLASLMATVVGIGIYAVKDRQRVHATARFITRIVNKTVKAVTKRRQPILDQAVVTQFLEEMHEDYLELRREKRLLWQPFLWGIVFLCLDVAMFAIVFWSLGTVVNPAPILIAYGLATLAGFAIITPGGSGAYEALMVSFLAMAGVDQGTAIAGVVVTRVLILLVILFVGYIFYQHALMTYGKPASSSHR
jgi:uncharacterized protein (TIRG00374 family)